MYSQLCIVFTVLANEVLSLSLSLSHGNGVTNMSRMYHVYHDFFFKSWTIGTKDRDSVTDALTDKQKFC